MHLRSFIILSSDACNKAIPDRVFEAKFRYFTYRNRKKKIG